MKTHTITAASVISLMLLLLTACGAEKPMNSVSVTGISNDTEIGYEIGIAADSVTVWHSEGMKGVSDIVALPFTIEDTELARNSLTMADIDGDSRQDIYFRYKSDGDTFYSYVLYNNGAEGFSLDEKLSGLPDLSFDGKNLISDVDMGMFGIRRSVFTVNENRVAELYGTYVVNALDVVRELAGTIYGRSGFRVERPVENARLGIKFGRVNISGVYCNVYTVSLGNELYAEIAVSDDGRWYMDDGGVCVFRLLENEDGKPVTVGEKLLSSGIPYGRLDVASYRKLDASSQQSICESVAGRLKADVTDAPDMNTIYSALAGQADASGENEYLFEYVCTVCGIDPTPFTEG